jgi:SAM-dependent methyltransferase
MADFPPPFTLRRGFASWWRDSLRLRGFWRTLGFLGVSFWELLRDCTPARRRMRFGDLEYDWECRVDTTWANVRLGTRLREIFAGRQYMPTDPELFRQVVGELGIEYQGFTFIDLGSGKGRALLLASEFPFRRIIGVELLPELHAVAQENARRYQDGGQQSRIELWCGDARQFRFPPEPLVVFLFDPFPEHVLEEVIAGLGRSAQEHSRPIWVAYQNPISEHVLSNSKWLARVRGNIQYAVYQALSGQPSAISRPGGAG